MTPPSQAPAPETLAPQLQAYAKLGRTMRWRPYLMLCQGGNVRSDVVNTDCHGFRWTVLPGGEIACPETPPEGPCGLLVGGSTAFGVGATGDGHTVASALSRSTDRPWLNLGVRAHGSTQELLTFLMHADLLPPVSHIVLLSGVNDLYLQYGANRFDDQLGAFLYSDRYFDAMEMARKDSPLGRLGLALRQQFQRDARQPFESLLGEREERWTRTLALLHRNLSHWQVMAASRSAQVVFALQPTFQWTGKPASPEEQALFDAREVQDPRHELMIEAALSTKNHEAYSGAVARMCDELGFGFVDLNLGLRQEVDEDEWIFIDRAHLNDRGYAACAAHLARRLE